MAEETPVEQGTQQTQVQMLVDERDCRTVYVNGTRIFTAMEEVVIDLGFNMPNPNVAPQQQQQQPHVLFKVSDRAIMSYATAKRLANSLVQLVKRYEQQFGEIQMGPGRR